LQFAELTRMTAKSRTSKKAFSLLELMVVLAIVGILAALIVGALSRYRATVALKSALDQLSSNLQSSTKQLARTSNLPHLTGVVPTTPVTLPVSQDELWARIIKKEAGQPLVVSKEFALPGVAVTSVNRLGKVDYLTLTTQGVAMEIGIKSGATFQQSFCVPIEPDGSLLTIAGPPNTAKTGIFVVSNNYTKSQLEINPQGSVKLIDNVP
jgi:prepilin-type N-terminal cleavage/methylation domain-containing protein